MEFHDQLAMREERVQALLRSQALRSRYECQFGFFGEFRFQGTHFSAEPVRRGLQLPMRSAREQSAFGAR